MDLAVKYQVVDVHNNYDCGDDGNGDSCSKGKTATCDIVYESKRHGLWQNDLYWYVAGQVCVTKVDHDKVKIKYTASDG